VEASRELRGYFLTGPPGVGKSTIVNRIVEEAERLGCRPGGIKAPEVREGGRRVGFLIVDVATGRQGWLARRGAPGPRVGSYGVIVEDVLKVGVPALEWAVEHADLVVIDEIGPMELVVPELREAIRRALLSDKPVAGVVHRALRRRDPELYNLARRRGPIVWVSLENRDKLLGEAGDVARRLCAGSGGERGPGTSGHPRPL